MSIFSQNLRNLREELGLTQTDLAKKLEQFDIKTSAQNVSYWEKGRQPPFDVIIALSKIFNVSIDYLIGATPYKTKKEELELISIIQSSNEIMDQRIVNTLINMKTVLTSLKEANTEYFINFINFLSFSKEYFLQMSNLSFDIQLEMLELKEVNFESIKSLLEDNAYKFRELEDIYFLLTKFLNSLSMDYKSNLMNNAISQLINSVEQSNNSHDESNL